MGGKMKHRKITGPFGSLQMYRNICVPLLKVFKKLGLLDCPVAIVTKHLCLVPLAPLIASSLILSCIYYEYTFLGANSGTRHIYALRQGTGMEGNLSIRRKERKVPQHSTRHRIQGLLHVEHTAGVGSCTSSCTLDLSVLFPMIM